MKPTIETDVYKLYQAKQPQGIISIPHSGEIFPSEIRPYLISDDRALAEDVDTAVDQLLHIDQLVESGVHVLVAKLHRTAIDLNRDPGKAVLGWPDNSQGITIVNERPDEKIHTEWLERYYYPFFNQIEELVQTLNKQLNRPVPYVDLHSMPSKATSYHLEKNPNQKIERPDFCLSDQLGKTCIPEYINFIQAELNNHGYNATINDPYLGGYVTRFVGELPTNNIQIEVKRELYMNEQTRELIDEKVETLRENLTKSILKLMESF